MKKLNIVQRLYPYGGVTTLSSSGLTPHKQTYVEHSVRLACLYVSPREQRMKAVLEFTYPQDETKLKHALRGEEYYLALVDIKRTTNWTTVQMDEMLDRICEVLDGVLEE